jgi:hypothetical protein
MKNITIIMRTLFLNKKSQENQALTLSYSKAQAESSLDKNKHRRKQILTDKQVFRRITRNP